MIFFISVFAENSIESILRMLARWHFPPTLHKEAFQKLTCENSDLFSVLKIRLNSILNLVPVLPLEVSERDTGKWQTSTSPLASQSLQVLR